MGSDSLLSHKFEAAGVGAGLPANKYGNIGENPVRGQARSYKKLPGQFHVAAISGQNTGCRVNELNVRA